MTLLSDKDNRVKTDILPRQISIPLTCKGRFLPVYVALEAPIYTNFIEMYAYKMISLILFKEVN